MGFCSCFLYSDAGGELCCLLFHSLVNVTPDHYFCVNVNESNSHNSSNSTQIRHRQTLKFTPNRDKINLSIAKVWSVGGFVGDGFVMDRGGRGPHGFT